MKSGTKKESTSNALLQTVRFPSSNVSKTRGRKVSFEGLLMRDIVQHDTYKDMCATLGLLTNDGEWKPSENDNNAGTYTTVNAANVTSTHTKHSDI